eukprot:4890284-Alexandrium_andersonii.AAC.1
MGGLTRRRRDVQVVEPAAFQRRFSVVSSCCTGARGISCLHLVLEWWGWGGVEVFDHGTVA